MKSQSPVENGGSCQLGLTGYCFLLRENKTQLEHGKSNIRSNA